MKYKNITFLTLLCTLTASTSFSSYIEDGSLKGRLIGKNVNTPNPIFFIKANSGTTYSVIDPKSSFKAILSFTTQYEINIAEATYSRSVTFTPIPKTTFTILNSDTTTEYCLSGNIQIISDTITNETFTNEIVRNVYRNRPKREEVRKRKTKKSSSKLNLGEFQNARKFNILETEILEENTEGNTTPIEEDNTNTQSSIDKAKKSRGNALKNVRNRLQDGCSRLKPSSSLKDVMKIINNSNE